MFNRTSRRKLVDQIKIDARKQSARQRIRLGLEKLERRDLMSSDGIIYFTTLRDGNPEIYSMNPDGSNPINLTHHAAKDSIPMVNSEGKVLTFASDRSGNIEIYRMNTDGTGLINLSNDPGYDYDPAPNEAGTKIAWVSGRSGNTEIWAANIDGSNPINLTNNAAADGTPNWSPDGTKIVFSSFRDNNQGEEIYIMNADGTGQTRLTNVGGRDFYGIFTPDGKKIAFTSERSGHRQIYLMNLDGSDQVNISNSVWNDQLPYFNYSGTKMSFVSDRDDPNGEIYIAHADGSGVTRITQNTVVDAYPAWAEDPAFETEPEITVGNVEVSEGNQGFTNANFVITLSKPWDETVTVKYSTANDSALAGSDYIATSGVLTFAPGQVSKTISVSVINDFQPEAPESFLLNLSNPSHASLKVSKGIGRIIDNDIPTQTDIRMKSATADGGSTFVVEYEIIDLPSAAFNVAIVRSEDRLFGGDSFLATMTISNPGDLSVGNHVKSWPIGSGAGKIGLPGAGAVEVSSDYYLLAVADPDNLIVESDPAGINEDNVAVFRGVYHVSNGSVLVHGSDGADQAKVGPEMSLSLNGVVYLYSANDVSTVRVRSHGSDDSVDATGFSKPIMVLGGGGNDIVTGGNENDTIYGGDGNDSINGGNGNDILSGDDGNDSIKGGIGNDVYVFDADLSLGFDSLTESSDENVANVDSLYFSLTTNKSIHVDLSIAIAQWVNGNLTLSLNNGKLFENVYGGSLEDIIVGNSVSNLLFGGSGNDQLLAGGGSDTLVGGPGNDLLAGGEGGDTYLFDADELLGSDSLVELIGGGVDFLDFSQTTTIGVAVDLSTTAIQNVNSNLMLALSSGVAFENIVGTSKNDTLRGNSLSNALIGGPGNDVLYGFGGRDLLVGGSGADLLNGGENDDILIAGTFAYFKEGSRELNREAIDGVMAEWSRTDTSYSDRVKRLRNGGGLNGNFRLDPSTVLSNDSAIDTLIGGTGNDWFWKNADDIIVDLDLSTPESVN